MFGAKITFLGIDPTAGERPLTYVALDEQREVLAMGKGNLHQVLAFVAGQSQAMVAVCAPQQPNRGLMERAEVREHLSPPPRPGRWSNYRMVEYQLRQRGINCPRTPATEQDCPNWMRVGFALYSQLKGIGYLPYPQEGGLRWLEIYPHACYCALLGRAPFAKSTLEGRIQRQLILYQQEIDVADPMLFFEEITRYRLLQGILPVDNLRTPEELDALVAAYTAWLTFKHPEQTMLLGDPEEGQIVLPVAELKSRY